MSLHGHFMIWMASHSDLLRRIILAHERDRPFCDALCAELSETIRATITAQLRLLPLSAEPSLSEQAHNQAHACPVDGCPGQLSQVPPAQLAASRTRRHQQGEDPKVLHCGVCSESKGSYATLHRALNQMGGTHNPAELRQHFWSRLPLPPAGSPEADTVLFDAVIASIQVLIFRYLCDLDFCKRCIFVSS